MCAQKISAARQSSEAAPGARVKSGPEPSALQKPETESWHEAAQEYARPRHGGNPASNNGPAHGSPRGKGSQHPFLLTQQYLGNQGVLRRLQSGLALTSLAPRSQSQLRNDIPGDPSHSSTVLQPKLKISSPGDIYEQEADRIAEHVVRSSGSAAVPASVTGRTRGLQRKCACGGACSDCKGKEEEQLLQMQPAQPGVQGGGYAPPTVHQVLNSPGRPLDVATRTFMETRFEHDFSQVRVHTDSDAAESAERIHARAYTVGQDIVFGANQFAPVNPAGRRLLAHELTHVVQQEQTNVAAVQRSPNGFSECTNCHRPAVPPSNFSFGQTESVEMDETDPLYFGPVPVICPNCHQKSEQSNFPTHVLPSGKLVTYQNIFEWVVDQTIDLAMKGKGRDLVYSALQRHEEEKLLALWAQPLADVIMIVARAQSDTHLIFTGSESARSHFAAYLDGNHGQLLQAVKEKAVDRLINEVKEAIRAYSCQSAFILDPQRVKQIEEHPDNTGVTLPVSFTTDVWRPGLVIGPIRVRSAGGNILIYELIDHEGIYFETTTGKMTRQGCVAGLIANESVKGGILFDEIWSAVSKFIKGLLTAAVSPVEMLVQGAAQVIDLASQSISAFGKWSGWYSIGYTCISSSCKNADACLDSGKTVKECQSTGLQDAAKAASVVIPLYEQGRACLAGDAEACGSIAPMFMGLVPKGGPRLRTLAEIERAESSAAKGRKLASGGGDEQAISASVGKDRSLTNEEFEDAAVRDAIGQRRTSDPHIAEALEKSKAHEKARATKSRIPASQKDVVMEQAVHESAQKAGSELKLDGETHGIAAYGKGAEAEFRFCSEPYCSIVRDKVGTILNELPKNYDAAMRSDLRHLFLEITGVDRDLKAGTIKAEEANRFSHKIANELESYAQRDRKLKNLLKRTTEDLRANRAQITEDLEGKPLTEPAPKPRTKPGTRGTAGTRAGRTYRIIPEEALAGSQRGYQVYEFRNAKGELLYVGKSGGEGGLTPMNWSDRLKNQHIETEWIGEARTVTVTSDLGFQESFALEEVLIPKAKYNKIPGEYSKRFPHGNASREAASASKYGTKHDFTLDVMF